MSFLIVLSTTGSCQNVPGLEEWRQHQNQVLEAERRLTGDSGSGVVTPVPGHSGANVPGLDQWQAQQAAALRAEKTIDQDVTNDGTETPTTESALTPKPIVNNKSEKLKNLLQKAIRRFVSQVKPQSEKQTEKSDISDRVLSLLKNKNKKPVKHNNFLDSLLDSYSSSEVPEFRRHFIPEERPRFRPSSSRLDQFYDGFDPIERFSSRRFSYHNEIEDALIESQLLDRELRALLRKID